MRLRSWLIIALFVTGICLPAFVAQGAEEVLKGKNVNINKATVEELAQVPLITKQLAEKIVKYREANGDFQVLEELLQVEGFTRDLLRRIKGFLLLEGIGGQECTC